MSEAFIVRNADPADVPGITAIYRHYVLTHTSTFEIEPPDEVEMAVRMQSIVQAGLPYLIAVADERILGYCYLTPYRPRAAYRYTIENSVYVAHDNHGRGVGSSLLSSALELAQQRGYRQVIAVIGDSNNTASINLHRRTGFVDVGTLRKVGFKFNRWLDTVLMQKELTNDNE